MCHRCVVDTSVIFPHKLGPPHKRALKNLMSQYLQVILDKLISDKSFLSVIVTENNSK